MRSRTVGAGLLVALAVLLAATMGGAVADSHGNETEANASVGAEVSSFMQASTAEAEGEVDDGMFEAALNRTDDPEVRRQLVENRTQRLEQRQQRLEERRAEIRGTGDVRDRALAVRVAVGADRLEQSVNETEPVAASVGVDTERLTQLRTNARNLTGGEVSDLARGLAGPPADRPGAGGPPGDAPAGNATEERPEAAANASDDRPGNETAGEGGQPDGSPGNGSENASDGDAGDGQSAGEGNDAGGGPDGPDDGQSDSGGPDDGTGANDGDEQQAGDETAD